MVFSSPVFLLVFLPAVLFFSFILPRKLQNIVLLAASLLFYAWGGVSFSLIMIASIIINYTVGRLISSYQGKRKSKIILITGISLNLLLLGIFKYANFTVDNINLLLQWVQIEPIKLSPIYLPIGISFFTFQAISYIVDVYKKTTPAQKNFVDLALYISLFPQLIAGPIVRYHDIAQQLKNRIRNRQKLASGIERFVLGLAKKVLIANTFAIIADKIFALPIGEISPATAWLGAIAYTFQIYFDFSGYSDMAIGLGRMFGFEILENFNFPYIAKSIREFWRRWHISLSNWFRDYLYIPLGGNRVAQGRVFLNLLIVFFLTGFWHGAAWNFVFWGLFHGFFLVIERVGFERILKKTPSPFQHLYVIIVVIIGWVFFRAENISYSWGYIKAMVGINTPVSSWDLLQEYLNTEVYLVLVIAILGSTRIFVYLFEHIQKKWQSSQHLAGRIVKNAYGVITIIFITLMLIISLSYLASNTYNPFIYFRF